MQLEDYFDVLASGDIRLKGRKIGVETILFDYLERGLSAEEIALQYPSLSLEEIHATLTYYWRYQSKMDAYLQVSGDHKTQMIPEQEHTPSPEGKSLYQLIQDRRQSYETPVADERKERVRVSRGAEITLEMLSEGDKIKVLETLGQLERLSFPFPDTIKLLDESRQLYITTDDNIRIIFRFDDDLITILDIVRQDRLEHIFHRDNLLRPESASLMNAHHDRLST